MNREYTEGATVAVYPAYGRTPTKIAKIARVTATGFYLDDGSRWTKRGEVWGTARSRSFSREDCRVIDSAKASQLRVEIEHARLSGLMRGKNWSALTVDQLQRIEAILLEPKP